MHQALVLCGTLFLFTGRLGAQIDATPPQDRPAYSLRVAVNEVVVTFHATGAQGRSVNDLKLSELRLLDNGKPPVRIIDFQLLQGLPIRAGILLDTSQSMLGQRSRYRAIAVQYAERVMGRPSDEAFVMDFGRVHCPSTHDQQFARSRSGGAQGCS